MRITDSINNMMMRKMMRYDETMGGACGVVTSILWGGWMLT